MEFGLKWNGNFSSEDSTCIIEIIEMSALEIILILSNGKIDQFIALEETFVK